MIKVGVIVLLFITLAITGTWYTVRYTEHQALNRAELWTGRHQYGVTIQGVHVTPKAITLDISDGQLTFHDSNSQSLTDLKTAISHSLGKGNIAYFTLRYDIRSRLMEDYLAFLGVQDRVIEQEQQRLVLIRRTDLNNHDNLFVKVCKGDLVSKEVYFEGLDDMVVTNEVTYMLGADTLCLFDRGRIYMWKFSDATPKLYSYFDNSVVLIADDKLFLASSDGLLCSSNLPEDASGPVYSKGSQFLICRGPDSHRSLAIIIDRQDLNPAKIARSIR